MLSAQLGGKKGKVRKFCNLNNIAIHASVVCIIICSLDISVIKASASIIVLLLLHNKLSVFLVLLAARVLDRLEQLDTFRQTTQALQEVSSVLAYIADRITLKLNIV